jgi:Ca2+/H+ antiporter
MILRTLGRATSLTAGLSLGATVAAFALNAVGGDHSVVFILSAAALAGLAALIGQGTEQLGHRFGPHATGILQSALGNLPELFISIFALQAGLVVVAIAGNAVENVVGVQMAMRNKPDLAISLILNSSLQVAIALTPALVLISLLIGGGTLTLVLSPLLLGAVALSSILAALIVFDGESTWLEGLALLGLYVIIAASVWYGPAIHV